MRYRLIGSLLLMFAVAAEARADEYLLDVRVSNDTALGREGEAVSIGVPFAEGMLRSEDVPRVYIRTASGQEIPSQHRVLAYWTPGASVRTLLIVFNATVPAFTERRYELCLGNTPRAYVGRNAIFDANTLRGLFGFGLLRVILTDGFDQEYYMARPRIQILERGPIRTMFRVEAYHRTYPGQGIRRDFLWTTAYVRFFHGQRRVVVEWFLKNSYTTRPLGSVSFKSYRVELRHGVHPVWAHGEDGDQLDLPASVYYDTAEPRPDLWAWAGNESKSLAMATRRAWQTFPKAVEVTDDVIRNWILPPGDYWLDDGQHLGAKTLLTWNTDPEETEAMVDAFNKPLLTSLDSDYLRSTHAFGDFGAIMPVPAGTGLPSLGPTSYFYGWSEYGEVHHSTHTTGSPRNRFSYLLPYLQTGHRPHIDWVEDQLLISMNMRPYHWNTFESEFESADFPGDRFYDGAWSLEGSGPGAEARRNIPSDYAPWQTHRRHAWNGWDMEHMTIDDLRDWYLLTGHPKALESIVEVVEALKTYRIFWDWDTWAHTGRTFGWCARAMLDAYLLTGRERYWVSLTHLVQLAMMRNGTRRILDDGWATHDFEPLWLYGEVQKGITNYDEFRPWMSAIGGIGVGRYLTELERRRRAGKTDEIRSDELKAYMRETADLMLELGWIPGEGFIYSLDIYEEGGTYSGTKNGTATWTAEFLTLTTIQTGDPRYHEVAEEIVEHQRSKGEIRGNPWYQLTLEYEAGLR
ncbi:MAG: hypothetical protein RL885_13980 [Planctomycetota bacterium]